MQRIRRLFRPTFLLITSLAAAAALPNWAFSQQRVEIPSRPMCVRCTVRLDLVATLGDEDGPGALGRPMAVARDRHGAFYVTTQEVGYEIVVFDPDGRYLKTLGRRGAGPGEYGFIRQVVPYGNRIHVFDSSKNQRWTILDARGDVLATAPIPRAPNNVVLVSDSLAVMNANIRSQGLVGVPLHVVGVSSGILRSFGDDGAVFRLDIPLMGWRHVALAGAGRVWSTYLTKYVIEQWDLEGRKRVELVREADWFEPHLRGPIESRTSDAPSPWITGIGEDRRRRLWTLVAVADPGYESTVVQRRTTDGIRYIPEDVNRYFDTVIEVLDPERGRLIASRRVDQHITHFIDTDHVAGYRELEDGTPVIDVWRVQLIEPSMGGW